MADPCSTPSPYPPSFPRPPSRPDPSHACGLARERGRCVVVPPGLGSNIGPVEDFAIGVSGINVPLSSPDKFWENSQRAVSTGFHSPMAFLSASAPTGSGHAVPISRFPTPNPVVSFTLRHNTTALSQRLSVYRYRSTPSTWSGLARPL